MCDNGGVDGTTLDKNYSLRSSIILDQEYGEEEVFIVIKEATTEEEAVALLRFYIHHLIFFICCDHHSMRNLNCNLSDQKTKTCRPECELCASVVTIQQV